MREKKSSKIGKIVPNHVIFQINFATNSKKRNTNRMASPESQGVNNSETSYAEFNALILRHKAMIWHICSDYRLGSAWKTEDCVQEVILNLWRSFKGFEGRSSEKPGYGALRPTPC